MQIIDSHVHFWDPQRMRYDWLNNEPPLQRPFLPADFRAASQAQEIMGIVFVQADCTREETITEVEWITQLANELPIYGIVAFAPVDEGDQVRGTLEALSKHPLVKGVRLLIQAYGAGYSRQPDFVTGVKAVADYGLSFDICIRDHQFNDVIELVGQCPKVSFVLDHLGKPNIREREFPIWQKNIKTLAAFPNVHCKLSGIVTEANMAAWTIDDLIPYVDHTIDVFGIERMMFGSDWPVARLASSYQHWLDTAQQLVARFSSDEQQQLFYENARRFYRLAI